MTNHVISIFSWSSVSRTVSSIQKIYPKRVNTSDFSLSCKWPTAREAVDATQLGPAIRERESQRDGEELLLFLADHLSLHKSFCLLTVELVAKDSPPFQDTKQLVHNSRCSSISVRLVVSYLPKVFRHSLDI